MIVAVSRSPTRSGGRAVLRCTRAGVGLPAIAALIVLPEARPTRIAGIVAGGFIEPDMSVGLFAVWTTTTAAAPAASAFATCVRLLQVVTVSTTAIAPAGSGYAVQPS